jgi:hypothetical protein
MSMRPRYFSAQGAPSGTVTSRTGAHRMLCSERIFAASMIKVVLFSVMTEPPLGLGKLLTRKDRKNSLHLAIHNRMQGTEYENMHLNFQW